MNERIKELAEQAWDSARDEIGSFVDDGGEVNWDFLHTYDKKFAELIAKECISKAERYGLGCDAVEQLKEDFGVEE